MRLLTYNVFWKALDIDQDICPKKNNQTKCSINIAKFIDQTAPYDFISLQEAYRWQKIRDYSDVLKSMESINHVLDKEEIVTFYQKKYVLDDIQPVVYGQMVDKNRPLMIIFFKQKIALINLHAGHRNDIKKLDQYISKTIGSSNLLKRRLKTYDIIVMGDMNSTLNQKFSICKRPLYGINRIPTCCDSSLHAHKLTVPFDHILSTNDQIVSQVHHLTNASDHLPVTAQIKQNIAYDFDGVLHKSVRKENAKGERYALNIAPSEFILFCSIINKIKEDLRNEYNVFIVTARSDNKKNRESIDYILKKVKLINQVKIYFSHGKNKADILSQLNINVFYDDSCLRVIEIYYSKLIHQLPNLREIYLVINETDNYLLIDENSIENLCPNYLTIQNKIIMNLVKNNSIQNSQIMILLNKLKKGIQSKKLSLDEIELLQKNINQMIIEDLNKQFY